MRQADDLTVALDRLGSRVDQVVARWPRPGEPKDPSLEAIRVQQGPVVTVKRSSGMTASATSESQRAHAEDLIKQVAARTSRSKALVDHYRPVLADSRAVVGFRQATKEVLYPLAAKSAAGSHLVDLDGNEYVDITMGFGALLLGHEAPCVREAVQACLRPGLRFGPRSEDTGEVASMLHELTGQDRVAFAVSGTEANSAAIRLARAATGRSTVVMFQNSYHGHVDSVLGRPGGTASEPLRPAVPASRGIPASALQDLVVLDYGSDDALAALESLGDRLAAVMVEPVQSRHPALVPADFVRSLREITRRRGTLLMFDEMLTGLRSHPGGAQHYYGVKADLATYGKCLGSGYPIGAIAGSADVMAGVDGGLWQFGDDSYPRHETTFFGGTYLQHPLSMAVARATLDHLIHSGPGLQGSLNARTDLFAETLNSFFSEEGFPLRIEHFGSMFRFMHRADMELFYYHLLLRGVYVWEWRSFYLSTAHSDQDLERVIEAVQDSLTALREAGFFREEKGRRSSRRRSSQRQWPPQLERTRIREAPASEEQLRLWSATTSAPPHAYSEVDAVRLRGQLDRAALQDALDGLVRRHDAFRTTFRWDTVQDCLLQAVQPEATMPLHVEDVAEESLGQALDREKHRVYDVRSGPLSHARLLRLGDEDHVLILGMHHLITDGHSMGIVIDDLQEGYLAATEGRRPRFAHGHGSTLDLTPREPKAADRDWWRSMLGEDPQILSVPADRPRTDSVPPEGGCLERTLFPGASSAVRETAARHRVTMHTVLFTAWAMVLSELSGQREVILSTTFGQRPAEAEETVGFFVTMLPVRVSLAQDRQLSEILKTTRDRVLGVAEHVDEDMTEVAALAGGAVGSIHGVVTASMDLDSTGLARLNLPGLRSEAVQVPAGPPPAQLALMAIRDDDELRLRLRYDASLYGQETALRAVTRLEELVHRITAPGAEGLSLAQIGAMSTADQERVLEWGQGEAQALPEERRTLLAWGPRPEADRALVVEAEEGVTVWSGQELLDGASAVLRQLREQGVGRGDVVAVAVPKGAAFVACLYAVLMAGATVLPVDVTQPQGRWHEILAQVDPVAVLVAEGEAYADHECAVRCLPWGSSDGDACGLHPGQAVPVSPDDVALILYTSGTTGRPKGIRLTHRNLTSALETYTQGLALSAQDRVSWYASVAFDGNLLDLLPALRQGAEVHLVPEDQRLDPAALLGWMARRHVTVSWLPTPIAEEVIGLQPRHECDLRALICGGEVLRRRPAPAAPYELRNIYGPAEASIFVTWGVVSPHGDGLPPIGRPVSRTAIQLRDERGALVPPGAQGEVWISGEQVSPGYLTEEGHQREPFYEDEKGTRWYRTGDLARWLPDGSLAFLGRRDQQVKVRGMRIEPAEVAWHVLRLDGVRDARVVPVRDPEGETALACYVLPSAGSLDPGQRKDALRDWRRELARRVPRNMVPRDWEIVGGFERNQNGKWSGGVAPVSLDGHGEQNADHAHGTSTHRDLLTRIWCEVLGVTQVADDEDFFDMGGHSLSAVRLVNRVVAELGVTVSVSELLKAPSFSAFAEVVECQAKNSVPFPGVATARTESHRRTGNWPVTEQQDRMLSLIHGDHPEVWNIASRVVWAGGLDLTAFTQAARELVNRHESLRERFMLSADGTWEQQLLTDAAVTVDVINLHDVAEEDRPGRAADIERELAARPFDVEHDGVVPRFAAVRLGEDAWHLIIVCHHLSVDGWSHRTALHELDQLYQAHHAGRPSPLGSPALQVTDYAVQQEQEREQCHAPERLGWWCDYLAGAPLSLRSRSASEAVSGAGGVCAGKMGAVASARVLQAARAAHVSPFCVVAACLAVVIGGREDMTDLVMSIPYAHRRDVAEEAMVALTSTAVPLRLAWDRDEPASVLWRRTSADMASIMGHVAPTGEILNVLQEQGRDDVPPLLPVTCAFQEGTGDEIGFGGAAVRVEDIGIAAARSGLVFSIAPTATPEGPDYEVSLEYAHEYATDAEAQQLVSGLITTISELTMDPGRSLGDVLLGAQNEPGDSVPAGSVGTDHRRWQE